MSPQELEKIGITLNGGRRIGWKENLGKKLFVSGRTIYRWASGEVPIKPATEIAIQSLLERELEP